MSTNSQLITLETFSTTIQQLHLQRITELNKTIENAIASVHAECTTKKLYTLQPITIPLLPPSSDPSTLPPLIDFLNQKIQQLTNRGFSAKLSVPTSNPYATPNTPVPFASVNIAFPIDPTPLQSINAQFFSNQLPPTPQ